MSQHEDDGEFKDLITPVDTKKVDFDKPLDLSVLKGRVALVTGGVAGIGLGVVRALVEAGAWVAICDLNEEAGRKIEAELIGEGYKYVVSLLLSFPLLSISKGVAC